MAKRQPKKAAPASVVQRASLTEQKIAECMEADQGASYRHYLRYYISQQEDAFRGEEGQRGHLGASVIGGLCDRELWYNFRWASDVQHDARLLRLFNRGHLEEGRFLAILASIGCKLYQLDPQGRQFSITGHGGHYGGSLDCVIQGVPDCPDIYVLGEFKTASASAYSKIVEQGVQTAKPEYYSQICQYMTSYNLPKCLFMVVNKDDDEIYCELLDRDDDKATADYGRAGDIIFSEVPPPRCSETASFWKCQYCRHVDICHAPESYAPAVNCRTCAHSTVCENGTWICENPTHVQESGIENADNIVLSLEDQRTGCPHYESYTAYIEQD